MLKKLTKSGLIWLWITVLVLLVDAAAKQWVMVHLSLLEPFSILPIFNLTLAYNTGAAFSFLHSMSGWQNLFLGSIALIVSIIILVWLYQLPRRAIWMSVALTLVLGGALGNAIDRMHYGYVVDFLDFHLAAWHFAIFNLADSAIFVGACMLVWHWFRSTAK